LITVSALRSLQCLETGGWVVGRRSDPYKTRSTNPKRFSSKTGGGVGPEWEPTIPGSTGKTADFMVVIVAVVVVCVYKKYVI